MKRGKLTLLAIVSAPLLLALAAVALVMLLRQGGLEPFRVPSGGTVPRTSAELIERGRYLAALGNCAGCHTAHGGAPFAGGYAFRTDYGDVYSSNITPDPEHGIGSWSTEEFRHTMRHGVSRNGVLSPVFPYASFRHLDDEDLDALLAYLRTIPSSDAPRRADTLSFPANLPGAMTAWRMLYFRPTALPQSTDAAVSRGAYLVEGIGHCATCHGSRGVFASQASADQFWGARNAGWFAPPLHGQALAHFGAGEVANYLKGAATNGVGPYGLMADVVARNLQFLAADDAHSIEAYLRALPAPPLQRKPKPLLRSTATALADGGTLYATHCAGCHGKDGEGKDDHYPPLRGSTAVTQDDPINLIKVVVSGAVAPSTPDHPAPYTMPPFAITLDAQETASVVNFLRERENPQALPVSAETVQSVGIQ